MNEKFVRIDPDDNFFFRISDLINLSGMYVANLSTAPKTSEWYDSQKWWSTYKKHEEYCTLHPEFAVDICLNTLSWEELRPYIYYFGVDQYLDSWKNMNAGDIVEFNLEDHFFMSTRS